MRAINYTKPNLENEWNEATRYPEFQKLGKELWINIARRGKRANLSRLKNVGNIDSNLSNLLPAKRIRADAQVNSGRVELPIVGRWPDGYLDLIGGNTRIATLLDKGYDPKVWVVNVPDVRILANFADGKNPQNRGYANSDEIMKTINKLFFLAKRNQTSNSSKSRGYTKFYNFNQWSNVNIYYATNGGLKILKQKLKATPLNSLDFNELNQLIFDLIDSDILLPLSLKFRANNLIIKRANFPAN
jgi:hypothetical protein